jgi:hypothetical protein
MDVVSLQHLGDFYRDAHEGNNAADKYVKALRLQVKLFGLDQPRTSQLLRSAADSLLQAGRNEDALKVVSQYYISPKVAWAQYGEWLDWHTSPEAAWAQNGGWLDWRASLMARQRRWREARADLALPLKYYPQHIGLSHSQAVVLFAQNDLAAYHQLCREMIARFNGTNNATIADRVAKDCLIVPCSGADLASAAALAETAVTRGKGDIPYTFYLCTKDLADYRQGKFQEVVDRTPLILKDPFPYTQAEGSAVLAMAQFKLGRTDEARTALAESEKVVRERLPPLDAHDLGQDWIDWVISHALLDEARSLIDGVNSTNSDWRTKPHE